MWIEDDRGMEYVGLGAHPREVKPSDWRTARTRESVYWLRFLNFQFLMCVPQTEAWIPMDTVAGAVLNLVLSRESPPDVLNVVHPRPARWTEVFGTINDALGAQLPFVPYAQWLAKLEALATNADNGQLEAVVRIIIAVMVICGTDAYAVAGSQAPRVLQENGFRSRCRVRDRPTAAI